MTETIPELYEEDDCRLCRQERRTHVDGSPVLRRLVATSGEAGLQLWRFCPICDAHPADAPPYLIAGRKWSR